MKRLIIALLTVISCAANAGPLYVPSTNGIAWPTTTSGTALTINSNGGFLIQCRTNPAFLLNTNLGFRNWLFNCDEVGGFSGTARNWATVPMRGGFTFGQGGSLWFHESIHNSHGGVFLIGGPDLVMTENNYVGYENYTYAGFMQLGSHNYSGGYIEIAYDGTGPVGVIGNSKIVRIANTSIPVAAGPLYYSYPGFVSYTVTNSIGDYYGNGGNYSDGQIVFYASVPQIPYNTANPYEVVRPGRSNFVIFGTNYVGTLSGAKFSSYAYTNRGSAGTATTTWLTGTGSPEGAVLASGGSYYSRTDGGAATSLYVKETATGNTGWAAVGGGSGDSLWGSVANGSVDNTTLIAPVSEGDSPAAAYIGTSGTTNLIIQAGATLGIYDDNTQRIVMGGGSFTNRTPTQVMEGGTIIFSGKNGSGVVMATLSATGEFGRADGATQPKGVIFPVTTTGIDAESGSATTLLTVPAGNSFVITGADVAPTVKTGVITAPVFKIIDGDVNDLTGTVTVTAGVGQFQPFALSSEPFIVPASGTVQLAVDTPADATTFTVTVTVYGYYR